MDGAKGPIGHSLRLRLALWLSASIVAVAAVAGAYAFWQAFDEAHELQDDLLRQVAVLVSRSGGAQWRGPAGQVPASAADRDDGDDAFDIDDESQVMVQPLGQPGAEGGPHLRGDLKNGMQTVVQGDTGYRVLVHSLPGGERFAVMQETSLRDEIAINGAIRTVLPLLLLVPLLVAMTVLLVHRMLRPVATLAREVDARSDIDLHAVPQRVLPSEIMPFVHAINRLLARVEQAMAAQRRFVADAAHELRSPMTALSLQAQRLSGSDMPGDAQERLHALQQGIERNRHLLDQLLAMARAQEPSAHEAGPVALQDVFRRVLEDLMPLAEARQIDIGMAEGPDVRLRMHAVDVMTVVKNLVDNAIRYAPEGGQVDLSARVKDGNVLIEVEDNGPGVPASERVRVFDAFYRVAGSGQAGSGLGLSIAKAIVDCWGGQIELHAAAHFATGLLVRVRLPARLAQ